MSETNKQHIETSGLQEEEEEKPDKGMLGRVLDPVGKGLGTALRPVGVGVETLTKPVYNITDATVRPILGPATGEHEEKVEVLGGGNKDSYVHGKDSLGGHLQTGDNPLGLDQTGKWGFREESSGESK